VTTPFRGRRDTEAWIARIRLGVVVFAVFQIVVIPDPYPPGYALYAWATTVALIVGAVGIFLALRRELSDRALGLLGFGALVFDTAIVSSYALVFSFEEGTPIRQLFFIPVIEGALRYGLRGGIVVPLALLPIYAAYEQIRDDRVGEYQVDNVTFQVGLQLITGLFVGWLVERLRAQTTVAESRAGEAERLRDELGRRVDLLEAANRCSRALGSSLNIDEAFSAFIRELRGLIPFERLAIVLAESDTARVIATAGRGADDVFPPGTSAPVTGTVLEEVLRGHAVVRDDLRDDPRYSEESELGRLDLRSEIAAPLLAGARTVGMVAVSRAEPAAFTEEEVELASLLGRLAGAAVQNIRAYESERQIVEELRRLSALRSDFVSLVSHELRSPMAAVIGAASTLQDRWRELSPDQRNAFLALIADETSRLSALITDVLDTSRIEAGTFTYAFSDVDVGEVLRETVATAQLGQDEVGVTATVRGPVPPVRGDRNRIRQVLTNLIDNAVKYSPAGADVHVVLFLSGDQVLVDVTDAGPGIPGEQHRLIFEKFGRAEGQGEGKPGTGLGLFIARSIAEAHGGSLHVRSAPERGATFTLALPASFDGDNPFGDGRAVPGGILNSG
jgi:signal transduction histidine kinase